jgi:heat shock protein HslJ
MKIIKLGSLSLFSILLFISCGNSNTTPVGDTSQNSLDWDGIYSNVIPCADCEGIQTTIVLNKDMTYKRISRYINKDLNFFTEEGSFFWDKEGRTITLEGVNKEEAPYKYLVGENKLIQYDMDGKAMNEETQKQYTLQKVSDIVGKKWKLIELNGKEIAGSLPKEPYFILSVENSRISGNGSCNSFNGTYTLNSKNRIKISPLASTMMACLDMTTESELSRVLEMVDSYAIKQDTLSLNRARIAPLARFVAIEVESTEN